MIKLKNVSKFYYSKGVIASGFTKINLEFKMGEFVAITGESGSGKSTLLNVISGLDSYEEGEMYINGEETSHYTEKDFEDYRRKYIGNIFQNFNLVNSYTVYQNIELVLLLNGNKKKDIKDRVISLIRQVDLYKFRNTKVSKLSGGQKQRVAIARALAKDTPIVIADEPTGNLDSRSAKGIIKLLSEISKDKLVIIVTHNYEQVEEFVTRKIKMHDGIVLEDKVLKKIQAVKDDNIPEYSNITFSNKIRLGIRNAFNIIPKFLLVFGVYLFITVALMSEYGLFKEQEYINSNNGDNYYFKNTNDKRIVLKKEDKSTFNEGDYKLLNELDNTDYLIKNDMLIDSEIYITDNENFWIPGGANDIANFKGKVDLGRMPENENEIVLVGSKDDYYLGIRGEELLGKDMYYQNMYTGIASKDLMLTVVGIMYDLNFDYTHNTAIYMNESILKKFLFQINQMYSNIQILFMDKYYNSNSENNNFNIMYNDRVPENNAYISSDLNVYCKNENCINNKIDIFIDNLYYKDNVSLNINKTYNSKTYNSLLGLDNYDINNGTIYINPNNYNNLFSKDSYQISLFVKDVNNIDATIGKLNNMGYETLKIKDTLVPDGATQIIQIMKTIITIILVITLFFISYFVIRIILKSRNVYYATIRILGSTKRVSKELLIIELLTVSNLAYFIFVGALYLNFIKIININFLNTIINYLYLKDYIILYVILFVMSYLISLKFAKKLFKNSAIKTIKEEV